MSLARLQPWYFPFTLSIVESPGQLDGRKPLAPGCLPLGIHKPLGKSSSTMLCGVLLLSLAAIHRCKYFRLFPDFLMQLGCFSEAQPTQNGNVGTSRSAKESQSGARIYMDPTPAARRQSYWDGSGSEQLIGIHNSLVYGSTGGAP